MDKTTVCNEAVAAETSSDTRDEGNNKSGMGFEARKCDWGDVRDDALSSDRHRGYTCAGVSECGAYSLMSTEIYKFCPIRAEKSRFEVTYL